MKQSLGNKLWHGDAKTWMYADIVLLLIQITLTLSVWNRATQAWFTAVIIAFCLGMMTHAYQDEK